MANRYQWSSLTPLQVGRDAKCLVKREFGLHGFDISPPEVDEKGIDFVVSKEPGKYYDVKVKSCRENNYIFLEKDKFKLRDNLLAAVVVYLEGKPPELFLIPSLSWNHPDKLLKDRNYEGKKSKPEWGLEPRHKELLQNFDFDKKIEQL